MGRGVDAGESAFQVADVRRDVLRDQIQQVVYLRRQFDIVEKGKVFQDRDSRLVFRRLDIHRKSLTETARQSFRDAVQFLRRFVRREDDLFSRVIQVVERVEQFLLRRGLSGDELHVVEQKDVDFSVLVAELIRALFLDRADEFVRKRFGGHVHDPLLRIFAQDILADRVHQMGLAQAGSAV